MRSGKNPSRCSILSRRSILAAMAAAVPRLGAIEEPPAYGISALLEGTGMVKIPAGEFLMGSDDGNADEAPMHRVRISHDFEIGRIEVTQAQWESVISDAHSKPGAVRVSPQGAAVSGAPSHFKG